MSPTKPTIVIVPGAWQLTSCFIPFADLLRSKGFETEIVTMPSVGGTELPLTGLPEDIAAVRAVIQPLVEAGREIVLLTHSAGGVSGGGAVKGLDVKSRKEAGLAGGVIRIIYMAAFMVPKGSSLLQMLGGKPAPWMVVEVSVASGMSARDRAFRDKAQENATLKPNIISHETGMLTKYTGRSCYGRPECGSQARLQRPPAGGAAEVVQGDDPHVRGPLCRHQRVRALE